MPQVITTPLPTPSGPFTVASGPMPQNIKVRRNESGVHVSINGGGATIPCTMAVRLAHQILEAALGDLHG